MKYRIETSKLSNMMHQALNLNTPVQPSQYKYAGAVEVWRFKETKIYRVIFTDIYDICSFEFTQHDNDEKGSWLCHEDEFIECENNTLVVTQNLTKLLSVDEDTAYDAFFLLDYIVNNCRDIYRKSVFEMFLRHVTEAVMLNTKDKKVLNSTSMYMIHDLLDAARRYNFEDKLMPIIAELKTRIPIEGGLLELLKYRGDDKFL